MPLIIPKNQEQIETAVSAALCEVVNQNVDVQCLFEQSGKTQTELNECTRL